MEIKPQDYIYFYIGQDVITPDGRGKLVGLPWSIVGQDRVSVHFGKMVATKNSIDGGYNKNRNHGEYLIKPQHLTPMVSSEDMDDIHLPGGVQLILRELSDMTEEEAMMVCRMQIKGLRECDRINITVMKPIVKFRIYTDGEDPDHGIERFMRIEEYLPTQFTYLLKQGFDLFGLIPAGLAIDKTSLKN